MTRTTRARTTTLKLFGGFAALLVIVNVAGLRLAELLPVSDGLRATSDGKVVALEWLSFLAWPAFPLMGIALWLVPQLKERQHVGRARVSACFLLMLAGILLETAARTLLSVPIIGNGLALLGSTLQLGAAAVYLLSVWHDTSRSVHPSVRDTLLQIGAVWLFGCVAVHLAQNLTLTIDYGNALYAQISIGLYKGFALGFVGNTGLWVLISTMPHFLDTREPTVRPGNVVAAHNLLLLAWVLAEVWSLHFPYTWVRLPLALVGFSLAGATFHLLSNLRVFDYLTAQHTERRRAIAQVAAAAFVLCMLASTAIVAVMGVWLGSSNQVALPHIGLGLREILQAGMGSYLIIGLFVSFLGDACVGGIKRLLAFTAIISVGMGLVVTAAASFAAPLTALDISPITLAGIQVTSIGHVVVGLWLLVCSVRS